MGDHRFDPDTIWKIEIDKAMGAVIGHPVNACLRRLGCRQVNGLGADGENGGTVGDGQRHGQAGMGEVSARNHAFDQVHGADEAGDEGVCGSR